MTVSDDVLRTLRMRHRMRGGALLEQLSISRATLMRAVQALGPQVISRGRARRTAYAARRPVRGSLNPLPLYRIDRDGQVEEVAALYPTHPAGCAVEFRHPCEWPLDEDMADGWFDGLPYPLEDMRPQGFLGRHFARKYSELLQIPDNPEHWSEDDVLHAQALLGSDLPGCYVLGEPALRQWLASREPPAAIPQDQVEEQYLALATEAMAGGIVGSSAGGEFPKFTAVRSRGGTIRHVIVKFSGSDRSPGTQRWSDLLVCEHLALEAVAQHLHVAAACSCIYQHGGRTFLEVERFDRHAARGRSPVCSWAALNPAMFALAGRPWTAAAEALRSTDLIEYGTRSEIERLWHFGQLIANTDMHDGNLSFLPGLRLAPAYDMLPMLYAPVRGVELPVRAFQPPLPLPAQREPWRSAAVAAERFWESAAADARISAGFRKSCSDNVRRVAELADSS